jgi:hypothetical protein
VPLGFGRPKSEDVVSLIAQKNYSRAIEVLRVQLKKRGASTTVRKQLADVLVLSGKKKEAVTLLIPLADQFAREGFAAKAVSILKRIQKIDPGRRDVDERLARLIEEKQREAAVLPLSSPEPEIGLEIGIEPPPSGTIHIPVEPPSAHPSAGPSDGPAREGGPEIGIDAPAVTTPTTEPAPDERTLAAPAAPSTTEPERGVSLPTPPPGNEAPIPLPPPSEPETSPGASHPDETLPASSAPAAPEGAAWLGLVDQTPSVEGRPTEEIEDYDLLYVPDDEEEDVAGAAPEEIELSAESSGEDVMTDGAFAQELMSLVDSMFEESGDGGFDLPEPAPRAGPQRTGDQIVVSPLFRDFSVDEMVAVIQGLKLLALSRGDVILREGQEGGSLYMLTSGRVRAFRKDPVTGKQVRIADLKEGAFFGEISILTGEPRTASIVALNSCELLELDRATLDEITRTHPHVWDVLREFAEKRTPRRG